MRADFRSDFVSRPTDEMRRAMFEAAGADPGFGPREDPIVLQLESLAAEILGKEDALFCPTCTLANQIAVSVHCRRGTTFVAEPTAHVVLYEQSASATLSGVSPVLVPTRRNAPDPDLVAAALCPVRPLDLPISLVWLENTHVHSGGTVVALPTMEAIRTAASAAGVAVHLDGARIFNAAIALGIDVRTLAGKADTVSISLNKGLSAPLGAILAGPAAFIAEAVRIRHLFGGGWRPATIPAAAGIVALETMPPRLADDHRRARRIAEGVTRQDGLDCAPASAETNIVLVQITRPGLTADRLSGLLSRFDLLVGVAGVSTVRIVTHSGIDDAAIDRLLEGFAAILDNEPPASALDSKIDRRLK